MTVFRDEMKNFEVDATKGIYAVRFGIQPYERFTSDGLCEITPWDKDIWSSINLDGSIRDRMRVYYNSYGI